MKQQETYQIVPRKYRPATFSEVVGQDAIVTTLKNSLVSKRIPHAYLFCGSRGTGKTTLARLVAKALNCAAPLKECDPCNICPSCREINESRSLTVIEIDGASHRGIDDIRQINETIHFTPPPDLCKIYIIDEVHMLTKEAFNALLKSLEEPPPRVKFFFATTEPHKLLPTIISRCQRFDLQRIPIPVIEQKLSVIAQDLHLSIEQEALTLIASRSDGSLRDAESLFDQLINACPPPLSASVLSTLLGIPSRETLFELDKAVFENNLSFAFELASRLFEEGKDLSHFLESLLEHYHTLLLLKIAPDHPLPTLSEKELAEYLRSAALYSQEQGFFLLDLIGETIQHSSRIPFKRLQMETVLLKIIRSRHVATLASLTQRLLELEERVSSLLNRKPAPSLEKKSAAAAPSKHEDISLQPTLLGSETAPLKSEEIPLREKPFAPLPEAAPLKSEEIPLREKPFAPLPEAAPLKSEEIPLREKPFAPLPEAAPLKSEEIPLREKPFAPLPEAAPLKSEEIPLKKKPSAPLPEAEHPLKEGEKKSHYDTLMRFTAMELEGSVKK